MYVDLQALRVFLVHAKRSSYAGRADTDASSRAGARELRFEEGDWSYQDSYFGASRFYGEETVRFRGEIVWVMNYAGRTLSSAFQTAFLKEALQRVSEALPYRGPYEYSNGDSLYLMSLSGTPEWFHGEESILRDGRDVYECRFHGGVVME